MTISMGSRIRNMRMQRGMTQEQLGEKLFVNKVTISMYETDKIDIKTSVILQLALALGVRPAYFFSGDEPDPDSYGVICSIKDIVDGFILPAS